MTKWSLKTGGHKDRFQYCIFNLREEDDLSMEHKVVAPKVSFIQRSHCTAIGRGPLCCEAVHFSEGPFIKHSTEYFKASQPC